MPLKIICLGLHNLISMITMKGHSFLHNCRDSRKQIHYYSKRIIRSSHLQMFFKIDKNCQYTQENTSVRVFFQESCRPEGLHFYLKETPTWLFSCEYCKIFKNSFFIEHLWWPSRYNYLQY